MNKVNPFVGRASFPLTIDVITSFTRSLGGEKRLVIDVLESRSGRLLAYG